MDTQKGGYLIFYNLNKKYPNFIDKKNFDVCIIGAGAAGITLALELGNNGKNVILCEAGDFNFNEDLQSTYKGEISSDPYLPLDKARLKFYGGSTNHWAGWCRPFEVIDFKRYYLGKHYIWPIDYLDLLQYRDKACQILEIPNVFELNENYLNTHIREVDFQFSPPVRFNPKFNDKLAKSNNISVLLNANLIDLIGVNNNIKSSVFANLDNKNITISAKKFIFAMGGIENSRYLLWFSKKYGNKFFNTSTPIGQYWMEHPHFTIGRVLVNKDKINHIFYATSESLQREFNILGCSFRIEPLPLSGSKKIFNDLLCVAPSLSKKFIKSNLLCGANFKAVWEQSPDINNKIILSDDYDRFGINRPNLIWKKNNIDRKTLVESINSFNNLILSKNYGRIQLQDWILNNKSYPTKDELGGNHHMGGTRMHNSIKYGVVDSNSKVYGSNNLYIAGSSVFTTGGYNNPTLPIIQLSLRLADYLINN